MTTIGTPQIRTNGAFEAIVTADVTGAPSLDCGIEVHPYKAELVLYRDDTTDPWQCASVILYSLSGADSDGHQRVIPVQFNDPNEDWSKAQQWVKDLAAQLTATSNA